MSIATLKKKTLVNNSRVMSTGKSGFSINGGYRNQGYIGQTSLSRSLPRTPMNGVFLRNSGGTVTPIVQSAVTDQEDNSIIKSSVLSSKGMIRNRYKYVNRPYPYSSTKPDTNQLVNTQEQYIERLVRKTISCETANTEIGSSSITNIDGDSSLPLKCSNIVKNLYFKQGTQSYGEYVKKLTNQCSSYDDFVFPTLINRTPLPSNT